MSAALMLADLKKSGLTAADAKALHMAPFPYKRNKQEIPAYYIPYLDLDGKPTGFYRLKLLAPCLDADGKLIRYWQEADSGVSLYFPSLGGIDWRAVMDDPSIEVWMVEGEKKAAAMCKLDLPCVGLGGVDNFQKNKNPADGLAKLAWGGRVINILFDSDA
jgi:hypothetical protein